MRSRYSENEVHVTSRRLRERAHGVVGGKRPSRVCVIVRLDEGDARQLRRGLSPLVWPQVDVVQPHSHFHRINPVWTACSDL
jgi:hypothetical protein